MEVYLVFECSWSEHNVLTGFTDFNDAVAYAKKKSTKNPNGMYTVNKLILDDTRKEPERVCICESGIVDIL